MHSARTLVLFVLLSSFASIARAQDLSSPSSPSLELRREPAAPETPEWYPLELVPVAVPPERAFYTAAYDSVRERMIIFGGIAEDRTFDDVWALSLSADKTWTKIDATGGPGPRREHAAVYDSWHDRLIVFGGADEEGTLHNDIWALSLSSTPTWTKLSPDGVVPSRRTSCAAFYQPGRHVLVIFGGYDGAYLNDVWQLNMLGTPRWKQLSPRHSTSFCGRGGAPAGRARMAFAPARDPDRLCIFGGWDGTRELRDCWSLYIPPEQDRHGFPEEHWNTHCYPNLPSARQHAAMAIDPRGSRMIVSGGFNQASGYLDDAWVVHFRGPPTPPGTIAVTVGPTARRGHQAIYDPRSASMLTFGGDDGRSRNDTWSLSCSQGEFSTSGVWTPNAVSAAAPPRHDHAAVLDPARERLVIFGGRGAGGASLNDVWGLNLSVDPSQWTELKPNSLEPSPRFSSAVIHDAVRDRMIIFGGSDKPYFDEVWSLQLADRPFWIRLVASETRPSARNASAVIYDSARQRMVLFGGWDGARHLDDVWALELSGAPAWRQVPVQGRSPLARKDATAVYDVSQDRMVITGGFNGTHLDDTWQLTFDQRGDGRWRRLQTQGRNPSPRSGHRAIHDPLRNRMVVFGGYNGGYNGGYQNDVWTLSLETHRWKRLSMLGMPPLPRAFATAVYDAARDRMVIFGGVGRTSALNDAWALEFSLDEGSVQAQPLPGAMVQLEPRSSPAEAVRPAFALHGAHPNPAARELSVAFTLPDGAPATLALFSVAGRLIESRDVGALGPGRHTLRIGDGTRVPPGVYFLRLTRAGHSLVGKVAVFR